MSEITATSYLRAPVQRFFFEESNNLHNELISLHNFAQPMATAMWHFRHVINEELQAVPPPSVHQLSLKYNTAPETRGTTNLIYPFCTVSWDDQRRRIAELILVNTIAIFEVWCEELCSKLGADELSIRFQFPTNANRSKGVWSAIDELTATESSPLKGTVYPALLQSKKCSPSHLDNLLKCFRYFKELRNCFMHRGQKCDGKLFGAQSAFLPIANDSALGMEFTPEHSTFQIGDPITLSLHGVLGFTDVILRIVTTIDAELSRSTQAETEIVRRIKSVKQTPIKRSDTLRSIFNTFGIQGVAISSDLKSLFKASAVLE